jgi:hypothetical protein
MRGWGSTAETWLLGLRTWQFIIVVDVSLVTGALVGVATGEWLALGHFDPSALVGSSVGTAMAATITAFALRDQKRERAKRRRAPAPGPSAPGPG